MKCSQSLLILNLNHERQLHLKLRDPSISDWPSITPGTSSARYGAACFYPEIEPRAKWLLCDVSQSESVCRRTGPSVCPMCGLWWSPSDRLDRSRLRPGEHRVALLSAQGGLSFSLCVQLQLLWRSIWPWPRLRVPSPWWDSRVSESAAPLYLRLWEVTF